MTPLKIYSSKEWFIEGNKVILMLAPFWGFNEVPESDPDHGRFREFLEKGKEIIELTDTIEQSEIAVYPQEYRGTSESLEHLRNVSSIAKASGRKLLVFYNADDDSNIEVDNCLIFRTSFYKSKQKTNEWALPGWSLDFLNYFPDKKFDVIEPSTKPSVSYCGYVDYEKRGLKDLVKSVLKPAPDTQEERAKFTRGEACR
ncbi:MAG TPA: hypothetical protein VGF30_04105, partial [Bacteroidia bacterium]